MKTEEQNLRRNQMDRTLFKWSLTAFVENASDEEYYTGTQENFGASGIRLRPHPRVIGASLQYDF